MQRVLIDFTGQNFFFSQHNFQGLNLVLSHVLALFCFATVG